MSLENLDFLLIPMNRSSDPTLSGHHWTLLVLDVKRREWQFLNSMVGEVEDPCFKDAEKMAASIKPMTNKQLIVRLQGAEVIQIVCPQQGSFPDCLLFTCYFMKRYAKEDSKSIEMDSKKAGEICR
ncbi:hypothetical protein MKX01_020563 [Papaver californicum]|nr:hypothetical protein MKX01_020563 [Papaver californicum]